MHTGNHNERPLDELVARGGRAVRRLSGLAASGLELGLLGKARRRSGSEVQNLDSRRRTERSCGTRRVAVAPIAVLVLFGGLLFAGAHIGDGQHHIGGLGTDADVGGQRPKAAGEESAQNAADIGAAGSAVAGDERRPSLR